MNYALTLAYNLVSETTAATERLYEQNKKGSFEHIICDLGFPLLEGDIIPDDLQKAKEENTRALKKLAFCYGSRYVQFENVGVQPNWTTAIKLINPKDEDVIVGVDPDEVPIGENWIEKMASAHSENIALVSLMQEGIEEYITPNFYDEIFILDQRVWKINVLVNWAFISIKGEFLNKINKTIPYPESAKIYGHIEGCLLPLIREHKYDWAILPDTKVCHTNNGSLYRAWKNFIILDHPEYQQISFDDFLDLKKDGSI